MEGGVEEEEVGGTEGVGGTGTVDRLEVVSCSFLGPPFERTET